MLKTIRMFATKGIVLDEEFERGEDDMAFVSDDVPAISIANDVILLPKTAAPKDRLSISYAFGQSSVLSIFESRIQRKIDEFRYIPEVWAT